MSLFVSSLQTYQAEAKETQQHDVVLIEVVWSEEQIIEKIRETFSEDPDVMVRIAKCEGVKDGKLDPTVISPTNDYGIFQLNQKAHGQRLKELNIDPLTVEGNLKYARMLYDTSGTNPWYMSKNCWYK